MGKAGDFFGEVWNVLWTGETKEQKRERMKEEQDTKKMIRNIIFFGIGGVCVVTTAYIIYS